MNLILSRNIFTRDTTIGKLFVGEKEFCYTLEHAVRGFGIKVPGFTAIPEGTYKIIVSVSPHFLRETIELLNVPMFKDIRIHSGNTIKDTKGCILAAYKMASELNIYSSAEKDLTELIKQAKEDSYIKIYNNISGVQNAK